MWSFSLCGFTPTDPNDIQDLTLLRQYRFIASDIGAAKQRLSDFLMKGVLPAETFYRLEGSEGEARVAISFYLFEGGRICPVRIWNRNELFGQACAGSLWIVDFNGIPPWSAIMAVQPRWHLLGCPPKNNFTIGRSARDWRKRNCWIVDAAIDSEKIAS